MLSIQLQSLIPVQITKLSTLSALNKWKHSFPQSHWFKFSSRSHFPYALQNYICYAQANYQYTYKFENEIRFTGYNETILPWVVGSNPVLQFYKKKISLHSLNFILFSKVSFADKQRSLTRLQIQSLQIALGQRKARLFRNFLTREGSRLKYICS